MTSKTVVDLSHRIRAGLNTYPGLPAPVITPHLTREQSRDKYAPGTEFAMDVITMIGNTGTYLDSPFHRYADGADLAGSSVGASFVHVAIADASFAYPVAQTPYLAPALASLSIPAFMSSSTRPGVLPVTDSSSATSTLCGFSSAGAQTPARLVNSPPAVAKAALVLGPCHFVLMGRIMAGHRRNCRQGRAFRKPE